MKWTWFDEVAQNIIGLAIVGAYLFLTLTIGETPTILQVFTAAVLVNYGFRVYKITNGTK